MIHIIREDMELSTDSEKHLFESLLDPSGWTSSQEEEPGGSSGSSELGQRDPGCLCQETLTDAESDVRRGARRKLVVAGGLTLVFMIGELIGGCAAHSLAIMTDAAHLLTDLCSILISLFSLWISSRPPTHAMTFGWHRAEILGMLLSVVSIWLLTAVLVWSAARRISDGNYDIESRVMLITSGCAVGINVLMVLILHQSGSSHGHSHGFNTEQEAERPARGNASVRAAFIHVLGDLLQSVGVLLAAIIIHIWPQCKVADPVCTFLFSLLVLATTFPVTKEVLRTLMQGAPQDLSFSSVRESLLSVRGVVAVHSLHMWSLNLTNSLLSAHVVTEEAADPQKVLVETTELLRSEFGVSSITIQVERSSADGDRTMAAAVDTVW